MKELGGEKLNSFHIAHFKCHYQRKSNTGFERILACLSNLFDRSETSGIKEFVIVIAFVITRSRMVALE